MLNRLSEFLGVGLELFFENTPTFNKDESGIDALIERLRRSDNPTHKIVLEEFLRQKQERENNKYGGSNA